MMDFYEMVDRVVKLLQQRGRLTYRSLKRQFDLDDDILEDLKEEILYSQPQVVDDEGKGLIWSVETDTKPELESLSQSLQPTAQEELSAQTELIPPEPRTPEAERRQLTVMFTDLVESTALSSQMDAEDYRELVRTYQATCSEVMERYDCHIAQTLGDGLLIYSGYPVAHENDAERAVRAGLGILTAMQTLNKRLEIEKGLRLAVRVGIHTGPVVVGEVGAGTKQEQLALGEVPNVAARIQGLAEPDTMVISADTYRLIQGYFDCEALGEHDLRGVPQPIVVYGVFQESGAQSRFEVASTRGLTPLVGREREVDLLLDRWEQAKKGQGQVVLLSGEAGIGKSRLVQALKDHLAEGAHIRLECRSLSYFTNSALYPIIEMVQRTLRFQTDDMSEKRLEKLEENLSQYRLPLEETVPLFGTLLSLPVPEDRYPPLTWSPQRQRHKTLEAIVAITLELSERQPVLFILEDLHWVDPTTLELLDLLIDQTPTASLYTVLTYRPEFQPSWQHRSYLTEITLNRLSQNQIEQMAEQVAGGKGLPDEIVQQLVDKTDGVPLYVEEMTKSVLESGVVKESDGQYELTGPVSSLAIPATLQDSLMARLDRLVTAKAVAQYASVIGRQFSYELLQTVSELDEVALRRELGRLIEAELVYQRGVIPQATYLFKHALVQDAAYQSLLRSTRQVYHRRIAQVVEERFPETVKTQPELLAHHYTEGGLHEAAVRYWQQAGEKAIQRSAHVEAIGHLTKGLEIVRTLPQTPEYTQYELLLLTTLGPVLMAAKGFGSPETEHIYVRALDLCQQVEGTPQHFSVLLGLGTIHQAQGKLQASRQMRERLLHLAQEQHDSVWLLQAHLGLGATLFWLGEFAQARTHFEQAIHLYDPNQVHVLSFAGDHPSVSSMRLLALSLWFLGYPDQALKWSHEAVRLAQGLAHPFSLAFALAFAAGLHQVRREVPLVQEHTEEIIALSADQGFPFWLVWGRYLRGWALVVQGQGAAGLAEMRQGFSVLAPEQKNGRTMMLAWLAEAYETVGQAQDGLQALADDLAAVHNSEEYAYEAELYRLQGALLLQQSSDNATEAETCFHKALDVARHQQAKSWELRAATSLARLWQPHDKRQEAYDLLAPVYGWFTEGFDTADLQEAKQLLGELAA